MEVERVAVEIGLEVNFGRETAARAAERLAMLPPFAPAAETWARAIVLSKSWTKCATLAHAPSGSSPRARGTHPAAMKNYQHPRFIPASAENTPTKIPHRYAGSVHPRERGEHQCLGVDFLVRLGSSPRARGTHEDPVVLPEPQRFIPASAGNTLPPSRQTALQSVHPRERGEHWNAAFLDELASGSSPRARGTQYVMAHFPDGTRFIPASAGKT